MAANHDFRVYKHMSLVKEKATLGNLITHLFSRRDIRKSDLFHHNIHGKENKYLHRGIVYLSLLLQISLKHVPATIFFKVGNFIEQRLNGSITDVGSVEYISIIGHMDTRKELDKEIKHDDGRYLPALSMMASKLAYENKSVIKAVASLHWKMEVDFLDCYNDFLKTRATQACIFRNENEDTNMVIVAFRGTSPFERDDWSTDIDLSWGKIRGMGKLHKGFMKALGLKKYNDEDNEGYWPKQIAIDSSRPLGYYTIKEKLKQLMMENNKKAKFIVTGHSLGGALAILFPAILALHGETELLERLEGIYTYGQPRVGDHKFVQFMNKTLREHHIKYYRIVYGFDIVPTLPWDNAAMRFKHFGTCIHFNSLYQGKVVEEKPGVELNEIDGYLRMISDTVVGMARFKLRRLVAVWELMRGFIIEFTAGPDYKEGWLLILLRISGILFTGAVNHNPQDYVNATRLASQDLFLDYNQYN